MQTLRSVGLVALFACIFFPPAAARAATLQAMSGSVSVGEGKQRIELSGDTRLPYELKAGQAVETGSDGKARIVLDDDSEVTLTPKTEIRIPGPGAAAPERQSTLELLYGKMRALITHRAPGAPQWRMRSSNAVMGVRGTEFVVDSSRDRTLMCAFDGIVDVHSKEAPNEVKTVRANEGVVISDEGRVSPPVTMDPGQMDWWRQETLLDTSESTRTRLRTLGADWRWGGPPAVEQLDPNTIYSSYSSLFFKGMLWSRINVPENTALGRGENHTDPSITGRLAVGAGVVPTRNYLLYAVGVGTIKSGHANSEPTGGRLHQAFVLVRPQSSHSLAVGRQEWQFGDGLIVGGDPWSPFTRSYDGVLATLRAAPARVRLFGASLEDRNTKPNLEDWFTGAYAEFSKLPLQLYGFWVKRGGANNIATANTLQTRHALLGARTELTPYGPFFANGEFAYELGTIGTSGFSTQDLRAWLGYADAGAAFGGGKLSGSLKGVFVQASGNANPGTGAYGSFIQLAPDSHRFLGLINAFPQLRNIRRLGATAAARYLVAGRPLTAELAYSHFDRVETADLTFPRVNAGSEKRLGDEVDLQFGFEAYHQLFFMLGGGILSQGPAYGSDQPNAYLGFLSAQLQI